MAKKSRPGAQPNPAIRLSNLRPRLDQLFADPAADPAPALAELGRLTDGLKPASFLPILVDAFTAAPEPRREHLDAPLGAWLRERGLLEALRDLDARQTLEGPARAAARAWLEAGGIEPAQPADLTLADLFISAYEIADVSQASPTMFWYEDVRRRRVRSLSFLIDFEPPWEGALKDATVRIHRSADRALEEFSQIWQLHALQSRQIDATAAARRVWTSLRQSYAQKIRLPADFILDIDQILPFLFALPVVPAVPPLSAAELFSLTRIGRIPEDLRLDEQTLGFQKRMEDGSIIRILDLSDDKLG